MLPFDSTGRQAPRHEMILEDTRPSGIEIWSCPLCGRRSVIRWLPDYERVVLDPGDDGAVHVGGTGGLRIGNAEVRGDQSASSAADSSEVSDDEAWRRWLSDHGIEWDDPVG